MIWVILIAVGVLLYRFSQVVNVTKQPKITCKRHTWVEAIMVNPETKEILPILFCDVCKMMPSEDINNPDFLEILE